VQQAKGDGDHVSLATAAAVVYHQVMGTAADVKSADDVMEALDRVAGAIANVAPIYTSDRAHPLPLRERRDGAEDELRRRVPQPQHPPRRHAHRDHHPQGRAGQLPQGKAVGLLSRRRLPTSRAPHRRIRETRQDDAAAGDSRRAATNPQCIPSGTKKEGTTASRALRVASQAASSSDCTLFGATVDGL
jgi:hypothetical protein